MIDVVAKLNELGWAMPTPPPPVASYVPVVITGSLALVSGQLPFDSGALISTGPVPSVVAEEQAQRAAQQCIVNALASLGVALDHDWSRLIRIVRIGVFVQSDDGYGQQPTVANGASDLLFDVFGEAGRHVRAAVGVNALPLNATVEIELTAEVRS